MRATYQYSKYPCRKCGKITKVRWLPAANVFDGIRNYTPDELTELKKKMPPRVDKPIHCHFCKAVVHTELGTPNEFEDVTK